MLRTAATLATALILATPYLAFAQSDIPTEQGVYEYVISPAEVSVEEAAAAIQGAAADMGWEVVSITEPGVPDGCQFTSTVLVLHDSKYASVFARANPDTAPFAAIDRVNVFEDESGVHVSVVNPHSINRTVMMNDAGYTSFSEGHLSKLRQLITSSVSGVVSDKQYGQVRDEGYIGRTMGVMAGGRFDGKIEELMRSDLPLAAVADAVEEALTRPGVKWGTTLSFRLDMPETNTVLFGTTGTPLDSRSFDIVRAGGDSSRDEFACPGIAHAAAYPLELVVTETEDGTSVRIVDAMYRMKLYFEDAGKFAFMKNMTMPGSIASEIRDKLATAVTL